MGHYIALDLNHTAGCKSCGAIQIVRHPAATKIQRIATNVNYLPERIIRALFESDAVEKLDNILATLFGNVVMVGTGGSFPAAVFASKCINHFHPFTTAIPLHPRDLIIRGLRKVNTVMLFSYSGKTKDIQRVYELCNDHHVQAYLITKMSELECHNMVSSDSLISYSSSTINSRERGFISIAGTLIPMCLFGSIYYDSEPNNFHDFLKESFDNRIRNFSDYDNLLMLPRKNLLVDVFSGYDTQCAALDLESKLVESGLGRVTIHEKKDFSHGRFNILNQYPPDLIVVLDSIQGSYSEKLYSFLESQEYGTICRLSTPYHSIWGELDLVIAMQYLAKQLSASLKLDMSRPEYPMEAMKLYRYSGKDLA